MELLNVIRARSAWLFDLNDLNPRGKSVLPYLFEWLKHAYHFSTVPSSATDFDETKALAFLNGEFMIRPNEFLSVDLRLYNDGLIGDTRSSTVETDAFLDDLLRSATAEFGLALISKANRRIVYGSDLTVRCEHSFANLNPRLRGICSRLSRALGLEDRSPFEIFGITLGPDPLAAAAGVQQFKFERKVGSPFVGNRYYSYAPLQTEDHLDLLGELEALLIE